jgi:phosphoglycerol transferase MdoB-like AlkP superfamily enzyme
VDSTRRRAHVPATLSHASSRVGVRDVGADQSRESDRVKRFTIPAPVRLLLVIAITFALSTAIDPWLTFDSPLAAQAVNAVLPVVLLLLLWAIGGRAWLALAIVAGVLALLRYADHVKVMDLNTDLVYADFTILGGLLKDPRLVLGFVHPTMTKIALAVAAVVVVVLVLWFTRRWRVASWKFRLVCLALFGAATAVIATQRAQDVIQSLGWQVFTQAQGARRVGVAGNVLLGRMTARDVKRPPDPEAERAFWNEPAVRKAEQTLATAGTGVRPDIVILQSESLFEPSQLCGFADTPVLKHVAQQQPSLPGNLRVPVFGGRTLQTEFEVLSGAPISYYPGSMFAYYELVGHHFSALPYVLDGMGYKTLAMHPNNRGFWHRGEAFPDMGFDTFQDLGSFIYPRDFSERGFVSDETLTRAILAELDSSNRPTFLMAISINNHGPWGEHAPPDDAGLGLPAKVTGEARKALADYVNHAIDADNAYGFLLAALAQRKRPTVVVMYGDHLPALPGVYKQLCFKDGKPPEDHHPPYRIWANFPMPKPPAITSAYLLQGWLLHVAGLPLKGHELANALAGIVASDPAVPPQVRKRVLREYANIAAATVAGKVPPVRKVATVFIGQERALAVLMKRKAGVAQGVSTHDGDLQLQPAAGRPARVAFDVHGAVASLTLRPFMDLPTAACRHAKTEVSVTTDGHERYRAFVTSKTLRLATLDLQGVQHVAIEAEGNGGAPDCDNVRVRVAQILCYSADCKTPGPALPAGSAAERPSRILADDPRTWDLAHGKSMTPLMRRGAGGKTANLDWMLEHSTGQQKGGWPLVVQPDAQLFMAPALDQDAWIDFDVTGLDTVELSPRIKKLTADCLKLDTPELHVGLVGLNVFLDGKRLMPRLIVDRDFSRNLQLDVKGGHTLRLDVDVGNDNAWCDWFSVGFPKLAGPAAAASTGAAALP